MKLGGSPWVKAAIIGQVMVILGVQLLTPLHVAPVGPDGRADGITLIIVAFWSLVGQASGLAAYGLFRIRRWRLNKRDELLDLFNLADRKGYDVTKTAMRDHIRLIGPDGNLVTNTNGGAAFRCAEARRYLEALPDRQT